MDTQGRMANWTPQEVETLINCCSGQQLSDMNSRFWECVAEKVNCVGMAARPAKNVKKKWADIKSNMKKKAISINKEQKRTGGGPVVQPLSSLEEKVMAALPACVVSGVAGGEDTFSEQLAGCSTMTCVIKGNEAEDASEDASEENMPGTSTSLSLKTSSKLTRLAQGKRKCTDDCLGGLLQVEKRKLAVLEEILDVQKGLLDLKRLKYSTESLFS